MSLVVLQFFHQADLGFLFYRFVSILPSMRVLAKELRISVITTKRAYEELERDGFLDNVPGKGCFVAPQNRELLREAQLRRVEDVLAQAVDEARKGGFSLSELQELLTLLYQGDEL